MTADLTILYRGPLSSCNYDCHYCPFAKRAESTAELAGDRAALRRFVNWIEDTAPGTRLRRFSVFFTPWGEALVRTWYQQAIIRLTNLPHVCRVAVQTNLSSRLDWVHQCDVSKLGLWCTYHPSQTSRRRFLEQCARLRRLDVTYSVGMVGLREDFGEIEAMRRELPEEIYLWINAAKSGAEEYTQADIERLEDVDPLFRMNTVYHASLGRACRAGKSVISVDGAGTIRRCHFIDAPIGNIYESGFERCLQERPCTRPTCGCHIGYVHIEDLELARVFGDGVLERVPSTPIWQTARRRPVS